MLIGWDRQICLADHEIPGGYVDVVASFIDTQHFKH